MAVLAILQHFLFSRLVILGASPDLLAVFVAYVSVIIGQRTGIIFGFSAGLLAGFLSGDPGLAALVGTLEGFIAGFFHVSPESHPTMVKKRRMFYFGAATAIAAGNLLHTLLSNPLALPAWLRIPSVMVIGTASSLFFAVLAYQLALKKILKD